MAKKQKIPEKFKVWIEVRKKYHLSHAHIQMARELGMNPKKFAKLANHKQKPWKLPLAEFIEQCYEDRFKKTRPDKVISIEERMKEIRRKKEEKRKAKLVLRKDDLYEEKGEAQKEERTINYTDYQPEIFRGY